MHLSTRLQRPQSTHPPCADADRPQSLVSNLAAWGLVRLHVAPGGDGVRASLCSADAAELVRRWVSAAGVWVASLQALEAREMAAEALVAAAAAEERAKASAHQSITATVAPPTDVSTWDPTLFGWVARIPSAAHAAVTAFHVPSQEDMDSSSRGGLRVESESTHALQAPWWQKCLSRRASTEGKGMRGCPKPWA